MQLACVVPLLLVVDADPISTCKGKSAKRWVELGDPDPPPAENLRSPSRPRHVIFSPMHFHAGSFARCLCAFAFAPPLSSGSRPVLALQPDSMQMQGPPGCGNIGRSVGILPSSPGRPMRSPAARCIRSDGCARAACLCSASPNSSGCRPNQCMQGKKCRAVGGARRSRPAARRKSPIAESAPARNFFLDAFSRRLFCPVPIRVRATSQQW